MLSTTTFCSFPREFSPLWALNVRLNGKKCILSVELTNSRRSLQSFQLSARISMATGLYL